MWVYKQSEPSLWTVGFYKPDGHFEPESDHRTSESAAQRVSWLNGGKSREELAAPGLLAALKGLRPLFETGAAEEYAEEIEAAEAAIDKAEGQ